MDLDSLLRRRRNGEDVSSSELAKAGVDLAAQLVDNIASATGTVDAFAEQLGKLGSALSNTRLSGLASKLNNLPDLSLAGPGFDAVSGILSVVSASFILSNKDADAGTKAAAGIEISTKILGNIGKAVSQYIIAQRVAAGLSTTAATGGLIGSVVALAISPLSFLNVADKFERAKQLEQYSEHFKKFGYEGDSLLASFYRETGAIEAALTTINSVLSAASAGVGAAATGSLVGAPVAALVSAITGIISGILDASKQAIFERVATKLANKIDEWEKKHGKNYFENGYDARHSAFLEDTFELLSQYNKEYSVERVVAITQQRWDVNIGELAGITRKGADAKSGKAYVDFFEEGKLLEKDPDRFDKKVFDPLEGKIDLSSINKTTLLKFVTPVFTAGEEIRERKQTGKYEYMTELFVKGKEKWVVTGVQSHNAIYDYTNLIQFAVEKNGTQRHVTIESHLGEKNDRIYLASGSSIIHAGNGHDVVYYDKTDTGYLTIDGTKATQRGEYIVSRVVGGDVKVLKEVTKTQEASVGKRSEKLEYRDYELGHLNHNFIAKDELHSVEEIIGSNRKDKFFGSNFTDIFHGGNGDDEIEGKGGHDILYGDDGNDTITGGDSNDHIYGGNGNDKLYGNRGNNFLSGGDGDDELQAIDVDTNNVLLGGKGNDKLYSGTGNDYLEGGEGNDYLEGSAGSDFYVYRSGYGIHTINEEQGRAQDVDKLFLADISFDSLAYYRIGDDIVLAPGNVNLEYAESKIVLKNWFKEFRKHDGLSRSNSKIEEIIDKDGNVFTAELLEKYIDDYTHRKNEYYLTSNYYYRQGKDKLTSISNEIEKIISSTGAFTGDHGKVSVGSGGPLVYNNSANNVTNSLSYSLAQAA
ncbi:RTX-I toxin determinant A [Actinobacillus lignieresii]|uniref:RTX-I toxin determinant A n=1 Tax=Actinobacillus lignieresii TaxID=720 RepID=A0A380U009_ACTLI|nr:RTX-I toxin determinant A [Actinobacillus lignieresii]